MRALAGISLILIVFAGCNNEPGIVTMESGVQFFDDTLGTGNEVEEGDFISIHFVGWIIQDSSNLFQDWSKDSTKLFQAFGNSRRDNPIKFFLGKGYFIKGCEQAIAGMRNGGTRTIIIPSNQAYGKEGYGPIPPDARLKVVVKLLSVEKASEV